MIPYSISQVKMVDKLSFTFGVLCLCGSEWLALRHADWFPLYYYAIMTMLLVWRFIAYSKDKYQLFMLGKSKDTSSTKLLIIHRFLLFCQLLRDSADSILPRKHQLVQGI